MVQRRRAIVKQSGPYMLDAGGKPASTWSRCYRATDCEDGLIHLGDKSGKQPLPCRAEIIQIYLSILGRKAVTDCSLENQNTFPPPSCVSRFPKTAPQKRRTRPVCWSGDDRVAWRRPRTELTAAATLAVSLPSRQQHLQAVPKHDCSRWPGPDYRKICWDERRDKKNKHDYCWENGRC